MPFTWRFVDMDDYWDLLTRVPGGIALALRRLDQDEREDVRAEIAARLAPFDRAGAIELPAVSFVASAS